MTTRAVWALVLGLMVGTFYIFSAAPSITVGDAGEFATAVHTLAIPHPSGFPAYTVSTRALLTLLPFGNPGYRVNVASAITGSLTILLVLGFLITLSVPPGLAVTVSLWLALTSVMIQNSTHTEVFALHGLLCMAALWAVTRERWALAGLLVGLAFANHQTVLLWLPAYLSLLPSGERTRRLGEAFLGFLIGASLYLFLFIRASCDPFLNVGNPDTVERWWRVLTRADYGTLTLALGEAPARTPAMLFQHLLRYGQGWIQQIGLPGILLAILGAWGWWRNHRRVAQALTLAWFFSGPFFLAFANMPFDAQSTGVLERFHLMPTLASLLLIAGIGFLVNTRWAVVSVSAGLLWVGWAMRPVAAREEWEAYTYGRNTLRSLPAKAMLVMDGGDDTFYSLAYLTQVEKRRADVRFHDRGGIVFRHPYGPDFRQLTRDRKEDRRRQVERALIGAGVPLYFATMNEQILGGDPLPQRGLVYSVGPVDAGGDSLWSMYDYRSLAPWIADSRAPMHDYRRRALVPFYAFQRSVDIGRKGQWEAASRWVASAHAQGPDVVWLRPNLVYMLHLWAFRSYKAGNTTLALRLYDQILQVDPEDSTALKNRSILTRDLKPAAR